MSAEQTLHQSMLNETITMHQRFVVTKSDVSCLTSILDLSNLKMKAACKQSLQVCEIQWVIYLQFFLVDQYTFMAQWLRQVLHRGK